jgi:hypothetical protein
MDDGDHSPQPKRHLDVELDLSTQLGSAMRAQGVGCEGRAARGAGDVGGAAASREDHRGAHHDVMGGETSSCCANAAESSREMTCAYPCEATPAPTTLREALLNAVRITALCERSEQPYLECGSLLPLSGAELALREATQVITTRAGVFGDSPHRQETHQQWLHGSKLPTRKREQAPALQISGPCLRTKSSPPKRCFAHALQSASRKVARGWAASKSGLRLHSRDATTAEGAGVPPILGKQRASMKQPCAPTPTRTHLPGATAGTQRIAFLQGSGALLPPQRIATSTTR